MAAKDEGNDLESDWTFVDGETIESVEVCSSSSVCFLMKWFWGTSNKLDKNNHLEQLER